MYDTFYCAVIMTAAIPWRIPFETGCNGTSLVLFLTIGMFVCERHGNQHHVTCEALKENLQWA